VVSQELRPKPGAHYPTSSVDGVFYRATILAPLDRSRDRTISSSSSRGASRVVSEEPLAGFLLIVRTPYLAA